MMKGASPGGGRARASAFESTTPSLMGEQTPLLNATKRHSLPPRRKAPKAARSSRAFQQSKPVLKSVFPSDARTSRALMTPRHPAASDSLQFTDEPTTRTKHRHSFIYSMLNPHSKSWQAGIFKRFISLIILVDLVLFVISTDGRFANALPYFHAEGIVSCIFLLEFVARLVTITESRRYSHPVWGRLAYMRTWSALTDLLATLPWFVEMLTGWSLPTLTQLRFFRLIRILKTESYARAMDTVYRVIYFNSEILYVGMLVCVYMILFTSLLLYYFRPQNDDEEESSQFNSLPATMYLSALMLTGQGGPEENDLPWYTRAVVLVTSMFSVAMFAIPASMLTWGFEAEAERMAKQSRRRVKKKREEELKKSSRPEMEEECGSESSSTLSSYSDGSDGNTTDEEYFRLIAGEDDDSSGNDDDSFVQKLKEEFKHADGDMDGNLSLKEFIRLSNDVKWAKSGGASGSLSQGVLEKRIETLEKSVEENTRKLDLILTLLRKK